MPTKTEWKKGISLDNELQVRLRAFVQARGAKTAAKDLGVSTTSILRGATGLGLRNGTILLIKTGLDSVMKAVAA